jgi:periplasmic divalent cation tolerance protein
LQEDAVEQVILVLCNVPDEQVAESLAQALVSKKLAACVNVLPAVRSFYQWQGQDESASEHTLLIKTVKACYAALQAEVERLHPYETPEIIAIPIADGLPAYLQWVIQETKSS